MKSRPVQNSYKSIFVGLSSLLAQGYLGLPAYGNEIESHVEKSSTMTITPEELKQAAIGFIPLVLFRKISSTEHAIGTRSHQTIFEIQVVMASSGNGSKLDQIKKWGNSPMDSDFHLSLIQNGSLSTSLRFPPNEEILARKTFAEYNEVIQKTNSKFMSMPTLRAAADGDAEIFIAKTIPGPEIKSNKRLDLKILKNLSGKRVGKVKLKSSLKSPLETDSVYFIGYKKAIFGGNVIEAKMVMLEDLDSIEKMYAIRMEVMKQPWTKSLAEH